MARAQGMPVQADSAQEGKILAAGETPLTQTMVDQCVHFIEWALDAPLTGEQHRQLQEGLVASWHNESKGDIASTVQMVKLYDQVFQLSQDQRDLLRAKVQPGLLASWRKQPNDRWGQWALTIYEAAHKPIASGAPPLTRQVADAYAEVLAFMIREVTQKPFQANQEFKDAWAKQLAANYAKLPAEQQGKLAQVPVLWAGLRVAWPTLAEADRAKLRAQWRGTLQALAPQSKKLSKDEAFNTLMARRMQQHNNYVFMSNMLLMNHVATMNAIATMGNSPYVYTYH